MLLTFAFLVDRGSWTRSWLPMAARFWPRQLISLPSPCTPKIHPDNGPNQSTNLPEVAGHLLPRASSASDGSMPCFFCLSIVQQTRCDPPFSFLDGGTSSGG